MIVAKLDPSSHLAGRAHLTRLECMRRDGGRFRGLLYLAVTLWLGSCSDPTTSGPISLSVVSGGDQEGLPGQELADPIVVR